MIESTNGSEVIFSSEAIADGIGTPLYNWGSSLLNLIVDFFPVLVVIAFFRIVLRIIRGGRKTGNVEIQQGESRAVSGTGKKYGSIGGSRKSPINKKTIKNRFGFK